MKLLFFLLTSITAYGLEVASLHPLITDAVKQVGGERVTVIEVMRPGMNVHDFQPTASDVREMSRASLIFASGKNLESYLTDLRDSLADHQSIIEVGETIPSQEISKEDQIYACCPHHADSGIDPHWWHNVKNMNRAIRVIEKSLTDADPEGAEIYRENAKKSNKRLNELHRWVKGQIATIPKEQRRLVSAHAAFGYFCKAYGLQATYVQGISAKGEIPAKQLANTITQIRDEGIKTIFPEQLSNPKTLKQIAKQTGAKMGTPLMADGSVASYEEMIRSNVKNIVAGLK